jgi:thiol-disulfide isomerase/thioredoxin
MKRKQILCISILSIILTVIVSLPISAQTVKPIKLKEFELLLNRQGDTIYVYNFFATWCKPCVKELPHFVKLANDSSRTNIKLTFINLDQVENLTDIVVPFVAKKKINQDIFLLNNQNYEMWMPRVDRRWGGSIPATLVVNGKSNKRNFVEGEISYKELITLINSVR